MTQGGKLADIVNGMISDHVVDMLNADEGEQDTRDFVGGDFDHVDVQVSGPRQILLITDRRGGQPRDTARAILRITIEEI